MILLASSEAAWYNDYSPTKIPHSCDFQCIVHNTDKIKGCASFSAEWMLMAD